MNIYRLSIPIFVLLLSACASAPPDQPRIAGLKDKPLTLLPVKPIAIDPAAALMTYRDFLKAAPEGPR